MQEERFAHTPFGGPARRPGDKWAFVHYRPLALPRAIDLDARTVLELSEAEAALGQLNGLGRLIPDPEMLLGPLLTREALASSRIEGTKASLSDVFRSEDLGDEASSDDVAEVERYLAANRRGLVLIDELPLTQRLIKDLHAVLMQGVRGAERSPGELRRTPVWVGSPTATIETARFVPPLPEDLSDLLADWERFVNEPAPIPVLVRCALAHYQFETIHPFLDGNGRIGRLIIGLMLMLEGRLSRPLLYLSGYFEMHRDEYYDRLQAVRENGDVQGYLMFFLRAVRAASTDAVERSGRLVELREQYYREVRMERSRGGALVPVLFSNPFLSVARVARAAGVSQQGARNLLERAEGLGWISQWSAGPRGRITWVAGDVLEIIEAPLRYRDGAP